MKSYVEKQIFILQWNKDNHMEKTFLKMTSLVTFKLKPFVIFLMKNLITHQELG
jgi:hypothetical protein